MEVIIIGIIALVILIAVNITYYYKSQAPQYSCLHNMETIKLGESMSRTKYLSTCKKCGYQTTYEFNLQ